MALDQVLLDLCCSMAEHSVHHIVPGARVSAAQAIQFTHHVSQQLSMLHQSPPQLLSRGDFVFRNVFPNFSFHLLQCQRRLIFGAGGRSFRRKGRREKERGRK